MPVELYPIIALFVALVGVGGIVLALVRRRGAFEVSAGGVSAKSAGSEPLAPADGTAIDQSTVTASEITAPQDASLRVTSSRVKRSRITITPPTNPR